MCKFYSAVVTKTGELYHNSFVQSHEDIISCYQIKDKRDNICRVEFYPDDDKDIFDYKKYNLHVDEHTVPDWLAQFEEKTIKRLRVIIKNMIITEDKEVIIGKAVLLKDCKIGRIQHALIYHMQNAAIGEMMGNSKVSQMWGNSKVSQMWENSKVSQMWENSKVSRMMGNSQVSQMMGNSKVSQMWENSKVSQMMGNSKVSRMMGNSQVSQMRGNSKVSQKFNNTQTPKK